MRARSALVAALLCSSAGVFAADKPGPEYGEVVFSDTVRSAFYERAPRGLTSLLRVALVTACDTAGSHPPAVCKAAKPDYLREVLVTGDRMMNFKICAENFGTVRYILPDMLEGAGCVFAGYDETHHIKVYFD